MTAVGGLQLLGVCRLGPWCRRHIIVGPGFTADLLWNDTIPLIIACPDKRINR